MTEFDKEAFAKECQRRRDMGLLVTGKTYDIREEIKALGGYWDGNNKGWLMPDHDAATKARDLVVSNATAGGSPPPQSPQASPPPTEVDDIPF